MTSRSRLAAALVLALVLLAVAGLALLPDAAVDRAARGVGDAPGGAPTPPAEVAPAAVSTAGAGATTATSGSDAAPSAAGPGDDADPAPIASHVLVVVHEPTGGPCEGAWVAVVAAPAPREGALGDLDSRPCWSEGAYPATDAAGRAIVPLPPGATSVVAYASRGVLEGRSEPAPAERWRHDVHVAPPDPPPPGFGALRLRLRANGGPHVTSPVEVGLDRERLLLDGRYAEPAGAGVVRGTTDGQGELVIGRLPVGAYTLRLSSPGWADVRATVVIEAATIVLEVELVDRGHELSGDLVPPEGVAAQDVHVEVITPLQTLRGEPDPAAPGRWRARSLPAGKHLVVGRLAGHAPRWGWARVEEPRSQANGPSLSWERGLTLRGRLVSAKTREPIARRRVASALVTTAAGEEAPAWTIRPGAPFLNRRDVPGAPRSLAEERDAREAVGVDLALEGWTEPDGRFELRGLEPGTHELDVGSHDPISLELATDRDLGDLPVGEESDGLDVTLRLAGRVTGPDGAPQQGSVTVLRGDDSIAAVATVDPRTGDYALEARLERRVWASLTALGADAAGHPLFSAPLVLLGQPLEVLDLTLVRAGLVRGHLRLPPALEGRAVDVTLTDGEGWREEVRADPQGRFEVSVPADRDVRVDVPGLPSTVVRVAPGAELALELDLGARPVVLPIVLVGVDPTAHAMARAHPEGAPEAVLGAPLHGGQGLLPGLPRGPVELEVEVEEPGTGTFWTVRRRLHAVEGMPPERIVLLGPRGRLRCVVGGPSLPDRVRATSAQGPSFRPTVLRAEVVAGPDGAYLLELPAGEWRVGVDDDRAETVRVVVAPEKVTEVTLPAAPSRPGPR